MDVEVFCLFRGSSSIMVALLSLGLHLRSSLGFRV